MKVVVVNISKDELEFLAKALTGFGEAAVPFFNWLERKKK